jgi:hypothetical protein
VTVSGGNLAGYDGTVGLTFAGGQNIQDLASNALTNTTPTSAVQTFTLDNTAPSGYSVTLDQDPVTIANAGAVSFTFSGAELGASYTYAITSSGGGGSVPGGGTIGTAGQQTSGLNVAGLPDGTLTLAATITDTLGNAGSSVGDTAVKDATRPTALSFVRQSPTAATTGASSVTFRARFSEAMNPATVQIGDFAVSGSASGSGSISSVAQLAGNPDQYDVVVTGLGGAPGILNLDLAGGATLSDAVGNALTDFSEPGTDESYTYARPTFALVFTPDSVLVGAASTLVHTIDNTAVSGPASSLDFTHTLASGLTVANPANAATTCTGGALTASAGAGAVSYTGGSVAASSSCTVTVDVRAASAGSFVSTSGDLTSTLGNSGTGSDTLTAAVPTVSVADLTVNEGDGTATVTVTLSQAAATGTSVNYATSDATATAGVDYTATSGTLTFGIGIATQTFDIPITGDAIDEPNETLNVTLSTPVNATIADGTAVVTINDDDNTPVLSIADATLAEGNAGTAVATFAVTLSAASSSTVTVNYATANGTALAGNDYVAASGVLSFAPGETSKTFNVTINGDAGVELDETFTATLTTPANATLGDAAGTGTITNDDAATVSIADVTQAEGDSGTSSFSFTVSLTQASDAGVSFTATTADGTASAGSDYTALSASAFTIAAGATSTTVPVTVAGDAVFEPAESFTLTLAGLSVAGRAVTILDGAATSTITNDDGAPTVTLAASPLSFNENGGTTTLTASLSAISTQIVTVDLGYTGVAATGPAQITIPAGQMTGSVTVTGVDNALDEADRPVTVDITSVTNGTEAGTQSVALTVIDDDGAPSLSAGSVSVSENAGTASFTVSLSPASNKLVQVTFATLDGTATIAGGDYTAAGGTLSFAPGEVSKTVTVVIADDAVTELDETFSLILSSPVDATLGTSTGVATITNDDAAALTVADISQAEGNSGSTAFIFTVSLSTPVDAAVSVDFATADATAIAGTDYTAVATTLTFAPGETSKTVTVQVAANMVFGGDRTFLAQLSNLVAGGRGVTIGDAEATGAITDDDTPPTLSLASLNVAETNGVAAVIATLNRAASLDVSFQWSTINGTAAAPGDYTSVNAASVTIPAGSTSATLPVTILDDSVEELAEAFTVALSGVTNAAGGAAPATVTIGASDLASPTVALTTSAADPVVGAFQVAVAFSEAVTGLELSDFTLTNGVAANLAGAGAQYTVDITPSADGAVTVALPAGAVQDGVGTANTASEPLSRQVDGTAPAVTLTTSAAALVSGPFAVTLTFSEAVTGLELADFVLANATAGTLAGSGTVYTVAITPVADGPVTVTLPASATQDAAGNASAASEPLSREADLTAPTVTLLLPGAQTLGAFTASFTFSEAVTGFEAGDITVTNGAVSQLEGAGVEYSALITPKTIGPVQILVPAGAAADAAGNRNVEASASLDAVSSVNAVDLALGSDVADPLSVGGTVRLTNPGSDPLSFQVSTSVPWLDVDPISGLVPASGVINLNVTLNARANELAPGDYVGTLTISTGGPGALGTASAGSAATGGVVLGVAQVALTVQARFGDLTLVATTPSGPSGDASFGYTSDVDGLDGRTLTTSGGRASVSVADLLLGQYTITQSLPAGWRTNSVSCSGDLDSGSQFDAASSTALVDLDPNESLVCTFENVRDEDLVRLATQRAIRNFMVRRADRIIEAAPDLSRRFEERGTTQRGTMGADVDGSGRYQMDFSASLSGLRNAVAAEMPANMAGVYNGERPFLDGWDIWLAAEVSGVSDNRAGEGAESDFGVAQLGVDYQLSGDLILGALAQYDWMDETAGEVFEAAGALRGARVQGEGWMAGPYAVWRIRDSLILDALAMYGRSGNSVDPLGLYEDDFDTSRLMVRANLTGEFRSGPWRLRPQAGITHFEETQDQYVDSLGIDIPEQTIALGRFRAGPELAWRHDATGSGWFEVSTALNAVWDYQAAELLNESGVLVSGDENLRADSRFGLAALTPWGAIVRLEAGFAGIGIGDFEATTGRFEIRIPFGAPAGSAGSNARGGAGGGADGGAGGGGMASSLFNETCEPLHAGFEQAARGQSACDRPRQ